MDWAKIWILDRQLSYFSNGTDFRLIQRLTVRLKVMHVLLKTNFSLIQYEKGKFWFTLLDFYGDIFYGGDDAILYF